MPDLCPCQIRIVQDGKGEENYVSKNYAECCQPFHLHNKAIETAEQLMRSRYSAYVLGNIHYIVQTTVPTQQSLLNPNELKTWSEQTVWRGLNVIQQKKISKNHHLVEFQAFFLEQNEIHIHHEHSYFVKIQEKWYFLDPTVRPKLNMKQPCLCGSGKKYKSCCADFLL